MNGETRVLLQDAGSNILKKSALGTLGRTPVMINCPKRQTYGTFSKTFSGDGEKPLCKLL